MENRKDNPGVHYHRRATDIGHTHERRPGSSDKDESNKPDEGESETSEGDKKDKGEKNDEQKKMSPRKKWLLIIIAVVVVLLLLVGGILYWLHARHFENTDDAFIDGHSSQVAPRVAGQIISLLITDNEMVKAGQLLVKIDPRDYEIRLAQAGAQQRQAAAQVILQQANIDQSIANERVAEAQTFQAERDLMRFNAVDPMAITKQQRDTAVANAKSAEAKLSSAKSAIEAAKAQKGAAEATLHQADVDVDNARLQLSYTDIIAPVDGRIARRTVEVGNVVSAGVPLLAVVSNDLWVTANFKETQLTRMWPGQPVRIRVDAFPQVIFRGHVDSLQKGSGEAFSVLPAENATGNYVKVVQRVPVKIVFDNLDQRDRYPLAPGMSVEPRVKVR